MSPQTSKSVLRGGHRKFGSSAFRAFFLLQFTRELIKQSGPTDVFELENILKKEDKELPQIIKKKIHEKKKLSLITKREVIFQGESDLNQIQRPLMQRRSFPRVLRIPEPKLPPRFQYLRPTPTSVQIDLNKLNPLIKDPMVNSIECNGADENIVVKGNMGAKKTDIILDKQEINDVIKRFSEGTKIPIQEGIFKVAIGKLILSAIISDVISSKFIIKKMKYAPREVFGR